jgi:2-keto-4-pentenoate hydratase/2-oxohepta-3-ene-1,7-dioic acid hydratase in catechol pathway
MLKRIAVFGALATLIPVAAAYLAWATSPDPKFNLASFEDAPLVYNIAPIEEAITLAQYLDESGAIRTLMVLTIEGESINGVDLRELGATNSSDPFEALASIKIAADTAGQSGAYRKISLPIRQLLPSGPRGGRHIGIGTNFPEHAEETSSGSVFVFPKFGAATAARTQVRQLAGVLLDYEVELCMRFDRDIASVDDFDGAVKGVFLCGDFTNRNALVELADPDNLNSGSGFSDAKSGPDYFPTGPFLVIPRDWQSFVASLRMTTSLNNEPRQDARGAEMILNFRELVKKSLEDMSARRFLYKHGRELLANGRKIDNSMAIMSGTSEGVIFTVPTRGDVIEGVVTYLVNGGPFSDEGPIDSIKSNFIDNELASGHFLEPGDTVRYGSTYLGNIEVKVVE